MTETGADPEVVSRANDGPLATWDGRSVSERTVLIFATHVSPTNSVGALRIDKLCRYLPEFGWRPIVVTVAESSRTPQRDPVTDLLFGRLDTTAPAERYEVHSVWGPNPIQLIGTVRRRLSSLAACSKLPAATEQSTTIGASESPLTDALALCSRRRIWAQRIAGTMVPDEYAAWIPGAVVRGIQIARRSGTTAILTSYPFGSGAVAATMVSIATRLPLVVDFRDAWMDWTPALSRGLRRQALERRLEHSVLSRSSGVTAVNSAILHKETRVGTGSKATAVVPQGWDPAEAADVDAASVRRVAHGHAEKGCLHIVHAGSVDPRLSDPTGFLRALLAATEDVGRPTIRVTFVGRKSMDVEALSRRMGLERMVESRPYTARSEVLRILAQADLLLLIKNQPGEHWITGKIWDYLTVRRPILGVIDPASAAADLIRSTQMGWVAAPWDERTLSATLRSIVDRFRRTGEVHIEPSVDELKKISAPEAARAMANVFDAVSHS